MTRFPILVGSVLVEVYNGPNAMAVQVIHQLPNYLVPILRGELRFSEDLFTRSQTWEQKDRDERRICMYLYQIQLHILDSLHVSILFIYTYIYIYILYTYNMHAAYVSMYMSLHWSCV